MRNRKTVQKVKKQLRDFVFAACCLGGISLMLYTADIKCLIKSILGIPCPGCGLTRAWLSVLKGNIGQAFKWHPLFWTVPILLFIIIFLGGRVFKNTRGNRFFWAAMIILFLAVYCYRLVTMFPSEAPMDYNPQALIYKLKSVERQN